MNSLMSIFWSDVWDLHGELLLFLFHQIPSNRRSIPQTVAANIVIYPFQIGYNGRTASIFHTCSFKCDSNSDRGFIHHALTPRNFTSGLYCKMVAYKQTLPELCYKLMTLFQTAGFVSGDRLLVNSTLICRAVSRFAPSH